MSWDWLKDTTFEVTVKIDGKRAYNQLLTDFLDEHGFSPKTRAAIVDEVSRGLAYFGMVGPRSKRSWNVRKANQQSAPADAGYDPKYLETRAQERAERYQPLPCPTADDIIAADMRFASAWGA